MRVRLKLKAPMGAKSTHRTYRDAHGTDWVTCHPVDSPEDLLHLAAGSDRIELREPPTGGIISGTITSPLIDAIKWLVTAEESADQDDERMRREMRSRLIDGLARIRVRYSRHLLAGVSQVFAGDRDQHVLVLAFVGNGITRCDWLLAA